LRHGGRLDAALLLQRAQLGLLQGLLLSLRLLLHLCGALLHLLLLAKLLLLRQRLLLRRALLLQKLHLRRLLLLEQLLLLQGLRLRGTLLHFLLLAQGLLLLPLELQLQLLLLLLLLPAVLLGALAPITPLLPFALLAPVFLPAPFLLLAPVLFALPLQLLLLGGLRRALLLHPLRLLLRLFVLDLLLSRDQRRRRHHHGRLAIAADLRQIFGSHQTPAYVGVVRSVRPMADGVAVLLAHSGMIPAGENDFDPALHAVHTLVAVHEAGRWRISLFQSTPAAWHGNAEAREALTQELRGLLAPQ